MSIDEIPVLAPTGALDLHGSRGLQQRLGEMAGEPAGDAVLDLSGLDLMDSVGLAVVLKGVHRFSRQGKRLILVVPEGGSIARLFELSGVNGRMTVVADRDAALGLASAER